jgi:hypothetical protein
MNAYTEQTPVLTPQERFERNLKELRKSIDEMMRANASRGQTADNQMREMLEQAIFDLLHYPQKTPAEQSSQPSRENPFRIKSTDQETINASIAEIADGRAIVVD